MRSLKARTISQFFIGVSTLAVASVPGVAAAQDAASTLGQPGPSEIEDQSVSQEAEGEAITITGIRASLQESMDLKRDAQGVVDAISAEDIGKFPDTNLAESLQRITGVSIDRSNGEGSFVTVRGFGPEYNLVTLNGRQMPTASLGDGASAPASRSFDFANLASEGISAVEVYKTGRAAVPSGGIGSSINIRTPRPLDKPGTRGSLAAKAVYDSSRNEGDPVTPEISGVFSTSFADDRIGILISGAYQRRKASVNNAGVGLRDAFTGDPAINAANGNTWGELPATGGNITNRPTGGDIYEIPQNAAYDLIDIDRERINGQLVLQAKPTDTLTATVDFTYSRNKVEARTSSVGFWFNMADTASSWTDGPAAGPIFYTENFEPGVLINPTTSTGKDLSYSGALTANQTENKSFGGNLSWEAPGGVLVSLDAHHSTAESKPTNKYGSSVSVGTAVFGVASQTVNFENEMPVLSYTMSPGINALDAGLVTPTGNAWRNAYFRDEINQVQLKGHYDHDGAFLDSIDAGFSFVENRVRSAYGFVQNETWGGVGPASSVPDDFFKLISIPDKFKGLSGAGSAGMIPSIYTFDFERMADLLESQYQVCSDPQTGVAAPGTCLAQYTTDRRLTEKTVSPYVQFNNKFDLFGRSAHLILGIRYDQTNIDATALVPIPNGTRWTGANEFALILGESDFTRIKGSYQNWLPAIDFDLEPIDNVKLRASYSHTITRADYASLQGGRELATNPRIGGGTGTQGNPGLVPYKSKNIDFSAEWYYAPQSYLSVGYFNKDVSNFIGTTTVRTPAFNLRNPAAGPRYRAAAAALGTTDNVRIRDYILRNFPGSSTVTGTTPNPAGGTYLTGDIFGLPEDDLFQFDINQPFNSDQTANIHGWEFAIQHQFWNTGFGTILNYTIVRGDATYDNTVSPYVGQFALTGLSDSANAVLFYDKGGLQARVAYNWRDEFYAGGAFDPTYVEAYGQIDASASYEFIPGLTAFAEAINLTGEGRRGHRRSDNFVTFAQPGYARYAGGIRFSF